MDRKTPVKTLHSLTVDKNLECIRSDGSHSESTERLKTKCLNDYPMRYICHSYQYSRRASCYDALPDIERPGFDSPLRHRIFRIANRHLFDPLLHLVANLISELEMHEGE